MEKARWTRYLPVNGKDYVALQKLFDPLLAGELFWYTNLHGNLQTNGLLFHASLLTVVLLTALFLSDSKVYEGYRKSRLWSLLGRVTEGWLKVVVTLIIIAYFAKVSSLFSRISFITWALSGWALLICAHIGSQKILRFLRSHGANCQHIIFLGSQTSAVRFFRQVQQLPYLGLNLKAWFSTDSFPAGNPLPAGMPAPAGDISMLESWLRSNKADQIHFCSSDLSDNHVSMKRLVSILGNTSLPVYYIPEWVHPGMRCNVEQLGCMYLIELWGHEDLGLKLHIKRFFDFFAALGLILFLSPLLLLLALCVKSSSPGPVIFCQDRYGLKGERFTIYKFRTMTVMEKGDQTGLEQAHRNDPRITPIGKFMRKWSLDELPQLFNVLNGSMSLVGPRPHAVAHNEEYRKLITGYMQRHQLRPGITGLAQVKGFRGETAKLSSMRNRIEADLQYLKDWSFLLDLEILAKTLLRLRSDNAY
ncbi:undecaprenyl-phosphate glucose phosphotransferase [Cyanobium sp. Copco_Reservoir_LC18]|uniref:undecaprenyl-phosphate glucose phosphotransferase n=1 Tax=Cyanobium sp. Copco_Reservoir_LC18 TaxID=1328305 RepID=UPI0013575D7F|nr:undecaprenyl-phosphate glucose phosphotransferase [Cyanobium sp. Copco_Reservoir_LC18]